MEKKYDIVVIGGGSGGLVVAAGAAKLGAKVALVEKHKLGGECLWTGCVPSKAIIHAAKVARTIDTSDVVGISANKKVNFSKVIDYVHRIQKNIEPNDSPERFRKLGVDVYFGAGRFESKKLFVVGKNKLRSKKFVISTGSSPFKLPIPGLQEAKPLTNETIFYNKKQPKTLLIIGGGPIGCEMAQAYARLGSKVYIFERGPHIMSKEDPDVSEAIEKVFEKEGIAILRNTDLKKVEVKGGKKVIHYVQGGRKKSVAGDEILAAVGRTPNISGLNLDGIGVKYDKKAIQVNEKLQTSARNIYAIGDVKGKYLFTHMAAHEAGIALMNCLIMPIFKANYSVVPWTTFTDPEVAHVGLSEKEAKAKYPDAKVFKVSFEHNDRAQTDDETTGFTKIITDKKGYLLSVSIIGPSAGELLAEFTLAMKNKLKISDIFNTIHTYPTLSLINSAAAGKFMETKLTPKAKKFLQRLFGFGK